MIMHAGPPDSRRAETWDCRVRGTVMDRQVDADRGFGRRGRLARNSDARYGRRYG